MNHNTSTDQIPPRPEGWQMDYSKCGNVTTVDGIHHSRLETDKRNLADKWKMFREMFRSQPERPLTGHNSYNPPMDQIEFKELNP